MSLSIFGDKKNSKIVSNYLRNYATIKNGESLLTTSGDNEEFTFQLTTKYYSAEVTCNFVDNSTKESSNCEAAILVISEGSDLETFSWVGEFADERDIPMRLLITLDKDEDMSKFVLWGLDYNFEYVNISTDSIHLGWKDREKEGLPRLLEALESHIWSSSSKVANNTSKTSVEAKSSTIANANSILTPNESSNISVFKLSNNETMEDSPLQKEIEVKTADKTNSNLNSPKSDSKTSQEDLITAMINSLEKVAGDDDENDPTNMMEKLMMEAKNCRDMARGGKLDDSTRREQAAAIALKLAAMMNLESDSD